MFTQLFNQVVAMQEDPTAVMTSFFFYLCPTEAVKKKAKANINIILIVV